MRAIAMWASIVCFVANLVPAVLYLAGRMDLPSMKTATIVATVAWFVAASFWIYGAKPPVLDEPVLP